MPNTLTDDLVHDVECERCGRCLTACPVYRQKRIETFSPRGRLDLIRAVSAGELAPGDRYKESIHSCLQCMACLNACPKGVEAADIIRREKVRMIRQDPGRRIPDISPEKSRFTYPETISPPAHIPCTGEIILFTGCFFGHVDTRPLDAAIRVLGENGIKIHMPKHQVCCGAPADLGGHPEILKQGCVQNLSALDGSLPVITLCATCGNALKNEYPRRFQRDVRFKETARVLGSRVKDIAQFLLELKGFSPGPRPIDKRVTLHMPCHLGQGMKAGDPVLDLLKRLPRLYFKEMDGMENCCGGGGLCALNNQGLSKELGDQKAMNIVNSGAQVVAAPCPGCLVQIKDRLGADNRQIESIHPIELVARTYR